MSTEPKKRVEYKLHYFNLRGRAEVSRLILAYAQVPYEDIRYEYEEWPQIKHKMPYGQLPVLEYKGQMLPQSRSIARFLAHRHGLGGVNDWEAAQIDATVDLITDASNEIMPVFKAYVANDEQKRKEATEEYVNKTLDPFIQFLEKQLAKNGTKFLVGSQVTLADLMLFAFIERATQHRTYLGCNYFAPKSVTVTNLYTRIGDIPAIRDWVKNRPISK